MKTPRPHTCHTLLAALAVVLLVAAGCQVAPPPGTSHSPSGSLDRVTVSFRNPGYGTTVLVEGWASDWDTLDPVQVAFFIGEPGQYPNGSAFTRWYWANLNCVTYQYPCDSYYTSPEPRFTVTATVSRPDVDAAFHRGANFGYRQEFTFFTGLANDPTICVAALNVGPGDHTLLGCRKAPTGPWPGNPGGPFGPA